MTNSKIISKQSLRLPIKSYKESRYHQIKLKIMTNLRPIIFSVLYLLVSVVGKAQTKLIEKVTKKGDELVIPYQKYVLKNGLTLLIHEDHSDPVVHVDVTYHVGSAREELKKSGFAHFFEHMMFQGSDHVADEEHFKIVNESGGTMNGSTNRDRTNYFQTVPSNQLETMLWLEADRMGFLLDAVTQKKFEVQRATVKNEKGQNYDNRPYGGFRELNAKALYPYGHPYSWLTIGILEDLDRVDVTDLKKFFLRWYGPNNATLTIGGDVAPKEVIKMAEKYFSPIPRGPEVKDMSLEPVTLDNNRYVSYYDKNIRFPGLIITFPTVPAFHSDAAALDCLSDILGKGKGSYFYKSFVESQKAIQASTFHNTSELAGEMTMFVLPFPNRPLADFEKEVRQALADFEKNGVQDKDIQKFKASYESRSINALASVSGKVSQLAYYETFAGNPNYLQTELKQYLNVSKEDVVRVYNKYIKGKPAIVQSVLAKEDGKPVRPDNYTTASSRDSKFPVEDYSGLTYTKAKDNFDRAQRPTPGKSPLVSIPELWKTTFQNGIKVIGTESTEIPTVVLQLTLKGGHQLDSFDKAGLAALTAAMMNESTENYSAQEIAEKLEQLGSSISFSASTYGTSLTVNTLKKNLNATLGLLEEKLLRPKFDTKDFERLKKQALEGAKAEAKQPRAIAGNVYRKLLYGEEHIFSAPDNGTVTSIEAIQLADVKAFYEMYYAPNTAELVVVGDIEEKQLLVQLGFLKKWTPKEVAIPALPEVSPNEKTKIYLVDKKGAPQSEIRIGYMTSMPYDATGEYFKTNLMNYVLGGNFNSRINLNLREDKGFTYGASSRFNSWDKPGPFTASAGVRSNATDSAVAEFMKEITLYHEKGISPDELKYMKNSIGQGDARKYETPSQKALFLSRIVHFGLDGKYVDEQNKIINKMTIADVNALTKKHLPYTTMNIVVVGDKESILPGLQKLGYDIVELDAEANPVKNPE